MVVQYANKNGAKPTQRIGLVIIDSPRTREYVVKGCVVRNASVDRRENGCLRSIRIREREEHPLGRP